MSCEETRRELMNADRPDRPPAAVRPHLAECPACRDWLRNLTEVEARVPSLPVPPSGAAKARVLKLLREQPAVPQSLRVVVPELPFIPPRDRGLRKLSVALALAAAVVLFAVGLSLWPRHDGPAEPVAARTPTDPVKWLTELRDRRLARAQSPRQKVEALAEFADDLLREARQADALPTADRLETLAKVYGDTVNDLQQRAEDYARAGPPDERRAILPRLASELGRTESEFSRLAAEAPEASAPHLLAIAAAAQKGDQTLRNLARGEST
jgi:hypothetical protein